jgi:hypothetical protein
MVSTSGNQKGGGYGSRQHVETSVRTGSGSKSTRPAGVSQAATWSVITRPIVLVRVGTRASRCTLPSATSNR